MKNKKINKNIYFAEFVNQNLDFNDLSKSKIIPKDLFLLSTKLADMTIKKSKQKKYLEAFFLASQTIENALILDIIKFILERLKLEKLLPTFEKITNFKELNNVYLALSQDYPLFTLLEQFRNIRNDITHRIKNFESTDEIIKKSKKSIKLFEQIFIEIDKRETGKETIPVLMLYINGGNDKIKQIKKEIKNLNIN